MAFYLQRTPSAAMVAGAQIYPCAKQSDRHLSVERPFRMLAKRKGDSVSLQSILRYASPEGGVNLTEKQQCRK
jgi:hypothetical protein